MIHVCAQFGAVQRVHGAGAALEHPEGGRTALLLGGTPSYTQPRGWPENPVPTPAQPPFWLWVLQPGWGCGFSSWMGCVAVLAWQCRGCLFAQGSFWAVQGGGLGSAGAEGLVGLFPVCVWE